MEYLDATKVDLTDITVARTKLEDDVVVGRELGKGSNNRVFKVDYKGTPCVLRAPRRRSDTQQRGSAIWEFRHTLQAARLGVGPKVYAAWYARHATREWPSGLYMVCERFDDDLETVLCEDDDGMQEATRRREALESAILTCLQRLATAHIFVYDLKPSNAVVCLSEDGETAVRIIDFGRDFCEWGCGGALSDPSRSAPNVDMIKRRIRAREPDASDAHVDALTSHILFAAMVVVLSSTTTRTLYDTRHDHRMGATAREAIHPLARSARALLDGMQGQNVQLLREVLRMDDVRGVLRHYHGRRSSGTRRNILYARGVENVTLRVC